MNTTAFSTMRRVWMAVALTVALLSFYPAFTGRTSWWLPGLAITFFLVFLVEPFLLTWELRKSGNALQISDDGIMRRLGRGQGEYVRWSDLREVSLVIPQVGETISSEYYFVLAGTGSSGVMISQSLAAKHDLLSHLGKLPGFDHRIIESAQGLPVNQRFVVWRARPLEGEATVIPGNRIAPPSRTLH